MKVLQKGGARTQSVLWLYREDMDQLRVSQRTQKSTINLSHELKKVRTGREQTVVMAFFFADLVLACET